MNSASSSFVADSRVNKIIISWPDIVYDFNETTDFEIINGIGQGGYGTVDKVLHVPSQTHMARKKISPQGNTEEERQRSLREYQNVLKVLLGKKCPFIVYYYGVKQLADPPCCLLCMELMDASLDEFYKLVHEKHLNIPEKVLGKIAVAAVSGLNFLKEEHKIIHRDIKPSNLLINKRGDIKICDLGISGQLVNSLSTTDIGCQSYKAVIIRVFCVLVILLFLFFF